MEGAKTAGASRIIGIDIKPEKLHLGVFQWLSPHWYFTFRSVLLGLSLDKKNHHEKACLCILTCVCICLQLQVSLGSRMLKVGTDHWHDLCIVWVVQQKSNLG